MSAGVADQVSPARGGLKLLLEAAVADGTVVRQNVSLAQLTTLRVGGQADWFAEPQSQADLSALVIACREHGLPVTALGLGSEFSRARHWRARIDRTVKRWGFCRDRAETAAGSSAVLRRG